MNEKRNKGFKNVNKPHSIYINDVLYHEINDLPFKNEKTFSEKARHILQNYVNNIGDNSKPAQLNHNGIIRFIDLFAGIGGIRLGFDDYKHDDKTECVFSSEWDKFAKKTYKANFGKEPAGDITKIRASQIPNFDVLLAGFPCQPFSTIGKRKGFNDETQGTLFFDIWRILKYHKPEAFILENVPGLLSSQHGYTFEVIKRKLLSLHYQLTFRILQAYKFGVPQSRRRLIIVGFRKDIDCSNFAIPTHNDSKTVYIQDALQKSPKGYKISKHLQNNYLFKKDDGHPYLVSRHDKEKSFAKTLNASYHKIQRITGTFVKGGSTGVRLLSKLECERIQGFAPSIDDPKESACPTDFKFKMPVSRTQMYRQMGNAVAVPMIKAVADNVKSVLRQKKPSDQHKFAEGTEKQTSLNLN